MTKSKLPLPCKATCLNCGKEIWLDVPGILGGRMVMRSKNHGCPEEFDQIMWRDDEANRIIEAFCDEAIRD